MEKTEEEEKIEDLNKRVKKDRRIKIILIIIIIILLLLIFFYILSWRMGKIGYNTEEPVASVLDDDLNGDENTTGEMPIIEIEDDDIDWTEDAELDIFSNEKFDGEKIIAPWSNGTYKFCIKNVTDYDISYDIAFEDLMTNPVNMMYKLKIDNVYIRGDEDTYVSIDKLNVDDILVKKSSNNVFTLEWYWADDDVNDTYTGSQKTDQYYTLRINIASSLYTEN